MRTKSEQKAFLDGYEMCAECIKDYLSDEGKEKLECLLSAVRNAVEIEDMKIRCNTCKNNDDELSGECYECVKGIFDHYEPEEVMPDEV